MRIGLAALVLLTGCSAIGLERQPDRAPQLAASNLGTFTLLPQSLAAVVGPETGEAIMVAQSNALVSEGAGVGIDWEARDASGRVTPGPSYMVNSRLCRDVVHEAEQASQRLTGRATLCLSRDGTWRRVG